jgi:uncharacterized protein (TIRG00374 family)
MRRFQTIVIILCLAFYVWFLSHFGTRQVMHYIRLAGWGLVLTISLEAFARFANTLGWWVTLGHYGDRVTMRELFGARVAGEAIDYLTPSQVGGQFVMAMMVRRKLDMAAGLSTAVVASLCEMVGQVVFIVLALTPSLDMVPAARHLFWPVVGGFALALALIAGYLLVQIRSPFTYLLRFAAKLPLRFETAQYEESAAEADTILRDFYARHHARLFASSLFYVIAWALGPVEIYILLRLLHVRASFEVALLVEAVGMLIERATFLLPAKLVSQEGGKALIFALLGYPASIGFAIGFLRRIKEMAWVLFGMAILTFHRMISERAEPTGPRVRMHRVPGEDPLSGEESL